MIPDDANKELLVGFIDESSDALASTDSLLLRLETGQTDPETVNAIFRPIHSLKGNCAYFGLMKMKKLAHTLENLLDAIRKGNRMVDRQVIECILPCIDMLKTMLTDVRAGRPELSDESKYNVILTNVNAILQQPDNTTSTKSVIIEINRLLDKLDECSGPEAKVLVDECKKAVSIISVVPSHPVEMERKNGTPTHQVGDRESSSAPSIPTAAAELLRILDSTSSHPAGKDIVEQIPELIKKMHAESPDAESGKVIDAIDDVLATFSRADTGIDSLALSTVKEQVALLKNWHQIPAASTPGKSSEDPGMTVTPALRHDKTMRISEQTLDDFLLSVGELLGIEEMLRNILRQGTTRTDDRILVNNLKNAVNQFEDISNELRVKIMAVRRVEASIFLLKTPRIVHDIAVQTGKKIKINVIGGEMKIDKSYIDILDAPLTHIVRNAADHGIESPQLRQEAGKDETGTILVTLTENVDNLQLVVEDDGAGLNYNKLQKKAESLGLVEKNRKLSETDVVDLLFLSGVSTAETVTDISGRGVGMDVVKRAVVESGGRIEVASTTGKGTRFAIILPRNASTQIIDGYIVRTFSDDFYVIPLRYVIEAFAFRWMDVVAVANKGLLLTRRGRAFPLRFLDMLLDPVATNGSSYERGGMAVIVNVRGTSSIIAVKEIVGIQKIVCKPVEGEIFDTELFDGAAIGGNGIVSMVLNMEKLLG